MNHSSVSRFQAFSVLSPRKLSGKISLILILSLSAMVGLGLMGEFALQKTSDAMRSLHADRVVPLIQIREISDSFSVDALTLTRDVLDGSVKAADAPAKLSEIRQYAAEQWAAYLQTYITEAEGRIVDAVKAEAARLDMALDATASALASDDAAALVRTLKQDLVPAIQAHHQELNKLALYQDQEAQRLTTANIAMAHQFRLMEIVLSLATIAAVSGLGLLLCFRIRRNLAIAVGLAEAVASGDLSTTATVSSKDEIGILVGVMNGMSAKLRVVVGEIGTAANRVADDAGRLSDTSEKMSSDAAEQAAATEETSASIEQMRATITQTMSDAEVADAEAIRALSQMNIAARATEAAIANMQTIDARIGAVRDIARQTDLLALNAAVEAARAGTHGRGFAVVAAEIRKLAERSQALSDEICRLSVETARSAGEAGSMLGEVLPQIARTTDMVGGISVASRQQAAGAEQIVVAIHQLDQVAQSNTSSAEDMAATAAKLSEQAQRMHAAIGFFRLTDGNTTLPPSHAGVRQRAQQNTRPAQSSALQNLQHGFLFEMSETAKEAVSGTGGIKEKPAAQRLKLVERAYDAEGFQFSK